jgi:hypothetical protein
MKLLEIFTAHQRRSIMDKVVIKFIADLLYCKDLIFFEEFEAIMEAKKPEDLDVIIDKILRGEYRGYKKGESYLTYGRSK